MNAAVRFGLQGSPLRFAIAPDGDEEVDDSLDFDREFDPQDEAMPDLDLEFDQEESGDDEGEQSSALFADFAPVVSQADLRTRIDEYFELANTEYTLADGTKVKARSQFRYARSGDIDKAKSRLAKVLGASFEKNHPRAIHYAVYGRATPAQVAAITQALIDAGELDTLRSANPSLTNRQLIRRMQREFLIGIDCAGYVQLAFIHAFMASDADPIAIRRSLGLHERRGYERLSGLPASHFTKLKSVTDAQTGDLLVLKPRDGDADRAWHTVIIVARTVSGTKHTFLGDASWGVDLYGADAGGIARRKLVHDTSTGEWWDIHPISGAEAHRNTVGPYNKHKLYGVFRAKQVAPKAQPKAVKELEASWEEGESEADTEEHFQPLLEGDQPKRAPAAKTRAAAIRENLRSAMFRIMQTIDDVGPAEARKFEHDDMADGLFNQMHPERGPRFGRISKSEPDYRQLEQDWLDARDFVVRPLLAAARFKEDVARNPLSLAPLEPGSIPTKEEIARVCRLYGAEMEWRCKEEQGRESGECYLERIVAEADCLKRILRRKRVTLKELKAR